MQSYRTVLWVREELHSREVHFCRGQRKVLIKRQTSRHLIFPLEKGNLNSPLLNLIFAMKGRKRSVSTTLTEGGGGGGGCLIVRWASDFRLEGG